jgi:hypothetical protein
MIHFRNKGLVEDSTSRTTRTSFLHTALRLNPSSQSTCCIARRDSLGSVATLPQPTCHLAATWCGHFAASLSNTTRRLPPSTQASNRQISQNRRCRKSISFNNRINFPRRSITSFYAILLLLAAPIGSESDNLPLRFPAHCYSHGREASSLSSQLLRPPTV